jgi:hypothetical protein
MKEQENSGSIAARNTRPFARNTASIDRDKLDIVSYRPNGTYLIEALPPLGPADGSGL